MLAFTSACASSVLNDLRTACITLFSITALSGCVNATVDEVRQAVTGVGADESVVLLGRRQNVGYETERDFVDCVGSQLSSKTLRIIPEGAFVDSMFPWFEPRVAPLSPDELPRILSRPVVAKRIKQEGIRYLVWIDGSTQTDGNGAFSCTISVTGLACFGFTTFDHESQYEASIWDMKTMTTAGKISSDATGTSYVPMIFLPIPIIARVQSSACDGMADRLRTFLVESGGGA